MNPVERIALFTAIVTGIVNAPLALILFIHHEGDPIQPYYEYEKPIKRDRVNARRWWLRLFLGLLVVTVVCLALGAGLDFWRNHQ